MGQIMGLAIPLAQYSGFKWPNTEAADMANMQRECQPLTPGQLAPLPTKLGYIQKAHSYPKYTIIFTLTELMEI